MHNEQIIKTRIMCIHILYTQVLKTTCKRNRTQIKAFKTCAAQKCLKRPHIFYNSRKCPKTENEKETVLKKASNKSCTSNSI